MLVMSGDRWRMLDGRFLELFTLRIQNLTSVFLRLFRSIGVYKRVPKLQTTGGKDLEGPTNWR